jgi:hypothetical protein
MTLASISHLKSSRCIGSIFMRKINNCLHR